MTTKKAKAKQPAKRGRGRPPIDNPANVRVSIRATEEQRDRYNTAAARAGMTLTAWIEAHLDEAAPA